LSALSTQAVPANKEAGSACQDKPDEAQPRPNHSDFVTAMALENICVSVKLKKIFLVLKKIFTFATIFLSRNDEKDKSK
jgi:hypothetical protein